MEATTVQQTTDKTHIEDWRQGVVELPADHVYGATALDDLSWQKLNDGPHGSFLVQQRCRRKGELLRYCVVADHSAVQAKIHHLVELTPGAFDPCSGPIRIVVTEVFR